MLAKKIRTRSLTNHNKLSSKATMHCQSLAHLILMIIGLICLVIVESTKPIQQQSISQMQLNVSRTIGQQQPQSGGPQNSTDPPSYIATGRKISKILNDFFDKGYDKRVRPNYGGPPVDVSVTMRILSISSVSEVQMDFTADFYFRQTWVDPRLKFTKTGDIHTLFVGAEVSKRIWLPDTFFGNEKIAYFHEATTPNVFLRIDHAGEVYRSIRLTVTSSCPMKLQYFPMDRQQCTIEAESYGYNVKDIIYKWARATAVERDKTISLPQFDITGTEQKTRIEELSSGTYSRLVAEIHFSRRMGYYLIQIYIPSSLIVVISWVSFWLHRNASPARVQLGVTTVLTMTTLMSSTNAALPKISYVKSIDVFLGTCFVMVFAALLEYATVGYLGKRIAMRKAHAQNVLSHAVAMTQRMVAAQNQANLMSSLSSSHHQNGANIGHHQLILDQSNSAHHQRVPHLATTTGNGSTANHQSQGGLIYGTSTQNVKGGATTTNVLQPSVVEQFLSHASTMPGFLGTKLGGADLKRAIGVGGVGVSGAAFPAAAARLADNKHLGKAKQLDSIFGVRPSSIDKYSRVVFPVCFVCFQLMYWIVYLHISAFLESNGLDNK